MKNVLMAIVLATSISGFGECKNGNCVPRQEKHGDVVTVVDQDSGRNNQKTQISVERPIESPSKTKGQLIAELNHVLIDYKDRGVKVALIQRNDQYMDEAGLQKLIEGFRKERVAIMDSIVKLQNAGCQVEFDVSNHWKAGGSLFEENKVCSFNFNAYLGSNEELGKKSYGDIIKRQLAFVGRLKRLKALQSLTLMIGGGGDHVFWKTSTKDFAMLIDSLPEIVKRANSTIRGKPVRIRFWDEPPYVNTSRRDFTRADSVHVYKGGTRAYDVSVTAPGIPGIKAFVDGDWGYFKTFND